MHISSCVAYDYFVDREFAVGELFWMITVSIWTLVMVPYLAFAPRFWERFANKFVILALHALTMLFWFAAFIPFAVVRARYSDYYGSRGAYKRVTAAIVFGAVEW